MGIDWWTHDPQLNSKARREKEKLDTDGENRRLRQRIEELESSLNELKERMLPGGTRGGAKGEAAHGSANR